MAKLKTVYVCTHCGTQHVKWQGRCPACGQWNTLVEDVIETGTAAKKARKTVTHSHKQPQPLSAIDATQEDRIALPDAELSRVLDGGLVPGSLILLGGEPGIGKSTLLLQLCLRASFQVLYVTGEESLRQVKLRADRLPKANAALLLLAETNLDVVLEQAKATKPTLLVIDSIQTLRWDQLDSAPGSIVQIRECTNRLMALAKQHDIAVVLVGHVNKDGQLAGPKVLEHMVDVVLEFEGERQHNFRVLRSIKNRFGATPELGIYEMQAGGLQEVPNPSALFLNDGDEPFSGVAIAATLQAQRPILIEAQALVAPAAYGTPQRSAIGVPLSRLHMLLAVLERRVGLDLGKQDVFINLAGGIRMDDPALDLALAVAIISSRYDVAVPPLVGFAAEIGLTGELRPVSRIEPRIKEAEKLGFERLLVSARQGLDGLKTKLQLVPLAKIEAVVQEVFNPDG